MKKYALILLLLLIPAALYADVQVKSGAGSTTLTVDSTSNAARFTPYNGSGESQLPAILFRGAYVANVRQSATTGAGACTFAIWNQNGTRTVRVKKITMQFFFDGTAAATDMKYEWVKGITVTAFSGGSAVTASQFKTSLSTPVSALARVLDTGLTTTGISAGGQITLNAAGRVTQTTTVFVWQPIVYDFSTPQSYPIELANQEILCLRQVATSVIGDNVYATVEIDEI